MVPTIDPSGPLRGVRVLLVEDEYYIADDFRRTLTAAGASVVGPCATVRAAQDAIEAGGFDVAVLDLNLNGDSAEAVAASLDERGVPFAVATGYGSSSIPQSLERVTRIEKPFEPSALIEIVNGLDPARTA